jgi:hypothetical protein
MDLRAWRGWSVHARIHHGLNADDPARSSLGAALELVAFPAFYVVYGLLALIPAANPSGSTGAGSCVPNGECQASTAGDAAVWFTLVTEAVGILALTAAALLNAVASGI